ncbi:MAG: hypothetical protein ACTSSH_06800 [Candidatus Heimdallarchaeota archaeon]
MKEKEQTELKRIYTERLKKAGYATVPELIEILPPTIMNITSASISTAEKLFVAALKTHMRNIQELFDGEPHNGINKALTDLGYMTNQEIAEANPTIIAKALRIGLDCAGDIVLYAMELSIKKEDWVSIDGDNIMEEVDREISHFLGKMDRSEKEKKLDVAVEEAVQKIHETIKLPEEEIQITNEQKTAIRRVLEQFATVFPSCTGFAMYNRRGEGIYNFSADKIAKATLAKINDTIGTIFWKISLALETKNDYGWINTQPHLIWIEAIRDRSLKQQLAYVGLFVFEASSQDGVGSATLTIKGIIKEIERIIYGNVMKN